MNQVIQTPAQHYNLSKLQDYDYVIVYKSESNTVADVLYRRDTLPEHQYLLLTAPTFDFLKTVLVENTSLHGLQVLHFDISKHKDICPHFSIRNGILYYKGNFYLSKESKLIPLFLQEFHAAAQANIAMDFIVSLTIYQDIQLFF